MDGKIGLGRSAFRTKSFGAPLNEVAIGIEFDPALMEDRQQ